jgi:hypothetical protein
MGTLALSFTVIGTKLVEAIVVLIFGSRLEPIACIIIIIIIIKSHVGPSKE